MPLFQYTYLNQHSKRKKGFIFEKSISRAKGKLFKDKIVIISIKPQKKTTSKNHFNKDSILLFFSQLQQLISSSIPLHESLSLLASQFQGQKAYHIISSLSKMVESGHSLSFALSQFPKSFPPYIRSLIMSGEASGALSDSLNELCLFLGWKNKIKKNILNAVSYPIFLLFFGFSILILVLLYVIPSIRDLFDQTSSGGISELVFLFSDLLQNHLHHIGLIIITCTGLFFSFISSRKRKSQVYDLFISLPIIKSISIDLALLSYFQIITLLFKSCIPLLDCLKIARQSVDFQKLNVQLKGIETSVEQGHPLSKSMQNASYIPSIILQLIEIGETSGNFLNGFQAAKNHFESRVQNKMDFIQKYAQPLLLLAIGFIIGGLMLSILIPLTDMSNLKI